MIEEYKLGGEPSQPLHILNVDFGPPQAGSVVLNIYGEDKLYIECLARQTLLQMAGPAEAEKKETLAMLVEQIESQAGIKLQRIGVPQRWLSGERSCCDL